MVQKRVRLSVGGCARMLLHARQDSPSRSFFFFNDTATTEIYTLSLHDALPISASLFAVSQMGVAYSQETRAYALLFVLAIGAAWLLDVALTERRSWAWYAFCLVSAALALTHYHSLWILIALWGVAVGAPLMGLKALPSRWWILGLALSVALVIPWFVAGGLSTLFATRESFAEMPSYF